MTGVVPLAEARDPARYGSKAVGLGEAIRAGLPVPPGIALSGAAVEAVATGDAAATAEITEAATPLAAPLAVRSSAADEDGAEASFAGQHVTLLNVASVDDLVDALCEIWWSANSDSAISYRQRVGLVTRPSVGVVVQSLLDPDVAGVMFTRHPVTGADQRMVEASWGLGEAVVAGLVIPDSYVLDRAGALVGSTPGRKQVAVRAAPGGGTVEVAVEAGLVERPCLDPAQLGALGRLATRCEEVYGEGRDIEWAIAGGTLYLLQCRAVTTLGKRAGGGGAGVGGQSEAVGAAGTAEVQGAELGAVPLFADLDDAERAEVARLFKERRFAAGDTVIHEGSGGAAFYLIDSGEANVLVGGVARAALGPGDWFGEIALIDEGPRSATVAAASDLVCRGVTIWDFRPLVEANGVIGWKLLQAMVKKLRAAEAAER
ncbi:MAG: cyclic nucleotide-binding domain-containing protein [Actinomycetota bacterium]|jgi:pyruvate,water dikinase|nr:cyclic nucleotide-binding domain-containing protein [Actinomycetota bacterium]